MTRVEELTHLLLDGELTAEGEAELRQIINTDTNARNEHLLLLELEGILRGGQRDVGVALPGAMGQSPKK
jgi:hypothetical protein